MAGGLVILLPAAGASARMRGADKLLEQIGAEAILRRQARRAVATGLPVAVSLTAAAPGRRAALAGLDVALLEVPDAAEGMSGSLRAGAAWASGMDAGGLMVALPDMPEITQADMTQLAQAFARDPARPLRAATSDGVPGHPVILPASLFAALRDLSGDQGARDLLRAHPPQLVPLDGQRALTDLDTPEDWAQWRKRSQD